MNPPNPPMDEILKGLQERAKELVCLYQVDEILRTEGMSWDERFEKILEAIPPGWQYSEVCQVRISFSGRMYRTPGFVETPWVMEEPLRIRGDDVGGLEVSYAEERPEQDEGPFLEEERKLLKTLAQQIGFQLTHEELTNAWESWESALNLFDGAGGKKWKVIVDFLDRADPQLLQRINRRMLNHLRWKGVEGLETLLSVTPTNGSETSLDDDNRPVDVRSLREMPIPTDRVFRIATENCSEEEILSCVQSWINRDKLSFLITTLEWRESSLGDITEALERFKVLRMEEDTLPRSVLNVLRAALLRRFFTDQIHYINIGKEYVTLEDFRKLSRRLVYPPNSHGQLGGKSAGMFLAWKILERSVGEMEGLEDIRVPKTWHVASDALISFVRYNNLEDVYDRKYLEIDEIRRQYPHVIQTFKSSSFPPEIVNGFSMVLEDMGDKPLIVRSSSLLEDRTGSAFSGKYKSLFLANQGSKEARLEALQDAVAEVYASIFGPDPIEYRAERNLLDVHEEMGIMIQEVVGVRVGRYFLPAFAGVAFSNNEFRWSPRIKREDGLVRLVPGLGTRAVDRLADDYPVLLAPGQPGLRVNTTPDEIVRYSPKNIDLINLEEGSFETVRLSDFLKECGSQLPLIRRIVSLVDHDEIRRPRGLTVDFAKEEAVVTFEGLATETPFIRQMASLLEVLRKKLGNPVDVEFASDGEHLYLLQCRPQTDSEGTTPSPIPRGLAKNKVLFSAHRYVSNGRIPDITHVVYVDPEAYAALPELDDLRNVGIAVGRLNKLLPKRQFILIGPGRWGSRGDIRLGVRVTYSDISNTALLVEVARKTGNYAPDLSFGTHFFQDLVESQIRYLPLYPDEPENLYDELFFRRGTNLLPDLLPEMADLADTVRVIDVPREADGQILRVLLNADLDEAVGVLTEPGPAQASEKAPRLGRKRPKSLAPPPEDYWQWRLQMAERIGVHLDPQRFGVKALWVFGSTKNATAGPASDIDLLVHFDGTEQQRRELLLWFEGWGRSLDEVNFLRTGYRTGGLLDVHIITDEEVESRTSYAVKIGAVTDPARPLKMGSSDDSKG
jgi:pyruvate,water dikinase